MSSKLTLDNLIQYGNVTKRIFNWDPETGVQKDSKKFRSRRLDVENINNYISNKYRQPLDGLTSLQIS